MSDPVFSLSDFRLDKDLKVSGIWKEFGGGAAFKIASFDNASFTEAFRKATKPYTDLGREVPEADQIEIMCRAMANFIVLDWRGIYDVVKDADGNVVLDDDGKEKLELIEYSIDNAYRLLFELEWIRSKLVTEAQNLANFRKKATEDTEKN